MVLKPIGIITIIIICIVSITLLMQVFKKPVTKAAAYAVNIPNSSVELDAKQHTPLSWHSESWGTNNAQFSYLDSGHIGKHSLKTSITSYTDGDAKWYFDAQAVTPGAAYTYTDYYKADTSSRIVVQFTKKDGSYIYKELKGAPSAIGWTKYQASFTVPADIKNMTVYHLLSAIGFLITDDYQVTNFVPEGFKRGLVSITWDDGIESQYTKAFPMHKKYGLPGSFFLISGDLDKDFYMTTAQAKEIQSAGNELGSHTVTHPHLTTLKADDIEKELQQSQIDLREKFGTAFDDFVTPYGDYNDLVISIIKKYYRSHRSVEAGYNAKNNFDVYNIVVQNVYTSTTPEQVKTWIMQAKADKTWLVLVYHQVDNPGDQYSVTSSDLDKEYGYLKKSGMSVVTLNQALKEILPQVEKN